LCNALFVHEALIKPTDLTGRGCAGDELAELTLRQIIDIVIDAGRCLIGRNFGAREPCAIGIFVEIVARLY
jgi:hypothetical protein